MKKTSKCKECYYSSEIGVKDERELACMYIVDECEPRGCPAGDECTKFKPRTRARRIGLSGLPEEPGKYQKKN